MTPRRRAFADSKPALAPGASKSYSLPFPMPDLVAITGAAGALGSEVARHLVARGYRAVLLGSSRSAGDLHALARSLDAAFAVEADVATKAGWDKALEAIQREAGSLPSHAVLVAGGWQGGKPLHDVADASHDAVWSAMIESNLETVHQSLRALLPDMVARGRGSIVVIGSRVVERPWTGAGAAAYAAAKAAAVELAQVAAAEVLDKGVRINAVLPSTLATAANLRNNPAVDASRLVSTSSAAAVIAFLLSDDARDVSGAAIPLYGRTE